MKQRSTRLELIADTYLVGRNAGSDRVADACWIVGAGASADSRRARGESAFLRQMTEGSAGASIHVEGGWYAILQVPRTRSEEDWAISLLDRHEVLVQPGFYFDFESEAYLVLSLLTPPDVFAEGLQRLLGEIG